VRRTGIKNKIRIMMKAAWDIRPFLLLILFILLIPIVSSDEG